MSWLEFIASVVSAVAWPGLIIALAVVARPFIKDAFPRILKLSARGFEVHMREQNLPSPRKEDSQSVVAEEIEPASDPFIERTERLVFSHLKEVNDAVKIPRLVRAFSVESMEKHFSLIYANIFGSQIRALQILNDDGPVSRSDAEKELKILQMEEPAVKDWTLDEYAKFLLNGGLVEFNERGFEITPTGRNFLLFLAKYNLSRNRPN